MITSADLRKSPVLFDPVSHTYTLDGRQLNGVTSTLIHRAFPDKYKGIDEETLAKAAEKGHELHSAIEFHDHFEEPFKSEDERINNYDRIKQANNLHTICNEYLVSDEEHYASSIDIVMADGNNDIILVDIKTTYSLDRASTGLQLSIYKRFFEAQNPGLKVARIYALWLPNRDHSIAEIHELSVVDDETLDALIAADLADEPFTFEQIPDEWADIERQYRYWSDRKEEAEQWLQKAKERMQSCLAEHNLSIVRTKDYTVSYIPAKTSKRFDSAMFKKEHKAMYDSYMKEVETAAQIRVTPKKEKEEK